MSVNNADDGNEKKQSTSTYYSCVYKVDLSKSNEFIEALKKIDELGFLVTFTMGDVINGRE